MSIRPIAIHLPQFHPIPENDEWWGKGFTEWRNVTRARPKFRGHYQPHLPADLGFYDLRLAEVRAQQAELARTYGIYGFCYYHYWFTGKRILDRPVREILEAGAPDFPFMLCWANENWTRAWDGSEKTVILRQEYSAEDIRAHAEHLIPYFLDPRYIRVDGRPAFIIYKDSDISDIRETLRIYREVAKAHGLELYLMRFLRRKGTGVETPQELGFDAEAEFQPLSHSLHEMNRVNKRSISKVIRRALRFGIRQLSSESVQGFVARNSTLLDVVESYPDFVDFDLAYTSSHPSVAASPRYPCVSPGWDNSSRRRHGGATIFTDSSPTDFQRWVSGKVANFTPPTPDENFLFINAWNEWAEGNHLEPCLAYGHAYLEALRDGVAHGLGKRRR